MGVRAVLRAMGLAIAVVVFTGCQAAQPVSGTRLIAHVAMIDFSGLGSSAPLDDIKVTAALPCGWMPVPPQANALFVHEQWRSPSHSTGLGVAYIHLPLPMSARMLLWFAKSQYTSQHADATAQGALIGEWTDSLGREWFEGENAKYHVKGYAVTDGFDAWVVYSGYRLRSAPDAAEISLAERSVDSVVPLPLLRQNTASVKTRK
jgi:hypothetical protein